MSHPSKQPAFWMAFFAALVSLVAVGRVSMLAPQPACLCEPAPKGDRGDHGPAGPQGEPGESCDCDTEHLATKLELATVAIESRTAIIDLRQRVAKSNGCCCEPTPAKPEPEVLPVPKPEPQSRVIKRRCLKGCCR